MKRSIHIKLVAVGDLSSGRTKILHSCIRYHLKNEHYYLSPSLDAFDVDMSSDTEDITLSLWDTAGQEDFDRLRPLSYPNVNVFLICFSLKDRVTLENVITKWFPEVSKWCPGVPIILVGTHCDSLNREVSYEEALWVWDKIGAYSYIECSSKKNRDRIFKDSVEAAIAKDKERKEPSSKLCSIM